jgi:hypothetical protein
MKQEKQIIQIKFGVPFFDVYDYQYNNFSVPVAIRGSLTFEIDNYKKLVEKYGFGDLRFEQLQQAIRDKTIATTKTFLFDLTNKYEIPVVQIERNIGNLNKMLKNELIKSIRHEFKLSVASVDITAMEIDKTSNGYRNLKAITQDVTLATVQAETQAKIKKIIMEQDAEIENYSKLLEIEREEIKNNPKLKKVIKLAVLLGVVAVVAIVALLIILL